MKNKIVMEKNLICIFRPFQYFEYGGVKYERKIYCLPFSAAIYKIDQHQYTFATCFRSEDAF